MRRQELPIPVVPGNQRRGPQQGALRQGGSLAGPVPQDRPGAAGTLRHAGQEGEHDL